MDVDKLINVLKHAKLWILYAGVPDSMQKLMYKGLLQDNQTLASVGITKGAKIMLVGSTLNDVLAVSSVSKQVSIVFDNSCPFHSLSVVMFECQFKEDYCEYAILSTIFRLLGLLWTGLGDSA